MTFKEWMHNSNPKLDRLANEAEVRRISDEEQAYENYINKKTEECYAQIRE